MRKYAEWYINALVAVVLAGLVWAMRMGWVTWSTEQATSFAAFFYLLILFLVVTLLGALVIWKLRQP